MIENVSSKEYMDNSEGEDDFADSFYKLLSLKESALKVVLYYILLGCLWFLLSWFILQNVVPNHRSYWFLNVLKGWFFVIASAAFIHIFVYYKYKGIMIAARKLFYFDSVTDLPNKHLMRKKLRDLSGMEQEQGNSRCMLSLDLDDFKHVNNCVGHDYGDQILRQIARALQDLCSDGYVARADGDKFSVLLTNKTEDEIKEKLNDILDMVATPWTIENNKFHISATIGYALYPEDEGNILNLQKKADIALSYAKSLGKSSHCHYEETMSNHSEQFINMGRDLREALDTCQLFLVYQPIVSKDNRIVALEALVRWQHPNDGMLSAGSFIPFAERVGLIAEIDKWVLQNVSRQLLKWQQINLKVPVSVNISSETFSALAEEELKKIFYSYRNQSAFIRIEITETAVLESVKGIVELLSYLKELGFSISLDDYGTGFCSLDHLVKLPIDNLKIDRSIISAIPFKPKQNAITKALIDLVHDLNMSVTAEGVETTEQLTQLAEYGCDQMQGYYLGRPMIVEKIQKLLQYDLKGQG